MAKRLNRLQRIREFGNYSIDAIAKMVGRSPDDVKAWEAGTAQPDMPTLQKLAFDVYNTSVDDLLGRNPFTPSIVSTGFLYTGGGEKEGLVSGFWGHVGVLTPGMEQTRWYPIDSDSYRYGYRGVQVSGMHKWACIRTLANRVLAINPLAMQRIWFLDEACDGPSGNWEDILDHNPFEAYRILDAYFRREWSQDYEAVPAEIRKGIEEWFQKWSKEQLGENPNWELHDWLHDTTIHFTNGKTVSYEVEKGDLAQLYQHIEHSHELEDDDGFGVPAMIKLDNEEFQSWFPRNQIAMIDMPLLDLWDGVVADNEENDMTPDWDDFEERQEARQQREHPLAVAEPQPPKRLALRGRPRGTKRTTRKPRR